MSEDVAKRTRKKNPLSTYTKAKAKADKVRRAHSRAEDLSVKAKAAADRAAELAAEKVEAEAEEQEALTALQATLAELNPAVPVDGDEV